MTYDGLGEEIQTSLSHPYGNPYSLWKDDIIWRKTKYEYVAITQGHCGDLWVLMKMGRNIRISVVAMSFLSITFNLLVGGGCALVVALMLILLLLYEINLELLIDLGSQLSIFGLLLVILNRFLSEMIKKKWKFLSRLDRCTLGSDGREWLVEETTVLF